MCETSQQPSKPISLPVVERLYRRYWTAEIFGSGDPKTPWLAANFATLDQAELGVAWAFQARLAELHQMAAEAPELIHGVKADHTTQDGAYIHFKITLPNGEKKPQSELFRIIPHTIEVEIIT
jgi:hypothetical protein